MLLINVTSAWNFCANYLHPKCIYQHWLGIQSAKEVKSEDRSSTVSCTSRVPLQAITEDLRRCLRLCRESPPPSSPALSGFWDGQNEGERATDEILQRILKKKEMAGYQYPV